ncbi:hypothetical protein [Flammeovirga aprica]|uniref:Uncharacterized protein n=1 Tax=Flammeovirga aprica JL-4 TaxID=694437 RepID=A0A7X9RY97_9BACT|nr:hypothetical protein [Flammeovirga aprica]NME70951.1 hypothetical protein [Flammeovirga aprica JL-4]
MGNCEQKIGIFTLKRCENRAEHQCGDCNKYFCATHFTEHGFCKSCYSKRQDDGELYDDDSWYWFVHRRREYEAEDLELLMYSEMMLDEIDLMKEEFEEQGIDAYEFDEGDVSYFDS